MLPHRLPPQLLASTRTPPEGEAWVHEVKYDGIRLLCRLVGGRARLYSRNEVDWTAKLPSIVAAAEALGIRDGWLDGELVLLDENGMPDFDRLLGVLQRKLVTAPVRWQVFDLLHLDGRDLTGRPLTERKARLEERVRDRCRAGLVRYCDHVSGNGAVFFRQAHTFGLEGIVSKRAASLYRPGVRSSDWLKVKCFHRYTAQVVGFTPRLEHLLVRLPGPRGEPVYAGRVSGWCRGDVRRQLWAALEAARAGASPLPGGERSGVRWVRPGVEVEVAALAWQPGRKLRHATVKRVIGAAARAA